MRIIGAVLVLGLVTAACGSSAKAPDAAGGAKRDTSATNPAANLRAGLHGILGAHVVLAVAATGASLGGRGAQFAGARAALFGSNSQAVAGAFADVYGAGARASTLALWRKHLAFFVDYAVGLREKDQQKQDLALASLLAYTEEFGTAIETLTEKKLTKEGVAAIVKEHIATLRAVIDAQAGGDPAATFAKTATAYEHMGAMAKTLGGTIAEQKSVVGDPASKAADLRANLNQGLAQHVAFATFRSAAVLGGRDAEAKAAGTFLDEDNAEDIARVFGSFYGPEIEKRILGLWRAHLRMVGDYTAGLAAGDGARSARAVADLTAYAETFGVALNAIVKDLPAAAVEKLVLEHITSLKAVIDAQAKGNWTAAYDALDEAMRHMDAIASALATRIAADKKL